MPPENDQEDSRRAASNDQDDSTRAASTVHASTVSAQPSLRSDPTAQTIYESTVPALDPTRLPPPAKLVGLTLEHRYFIEKELGHGGIGCVYLARDAKLVNKPVVVKVLLEKTLQNEWALRKFEHEKEALARVDHPGIIGILDTGELPDGKPYLVMQYVEGITLRSVLKPEGVALDYTAQLIEQIGHALGAAHEEGILHRDLKPENIMIQRLAGGREQVKIIDFGIAKVRDSQVAPSTLAAATAGTIVYMSPEQLQGEKVTVASDVYALGVIAYEMVAGRRPFNPETGFQLPEMQREGVHVKPKDLRPALPESAQAVILKALAFNKQDRYQSAAAFGEEFARAIKGEAETPLLDAHLESRTKTSPAHPVVEKAQKPGLSRVLIAAATALLLISLAGLGLWWMLKSSSDTPKPSNSSASSSSPPPATASPQRTLNYWLTVQKMRDGKPYQEQFDSSGQEIFENGWKFRFNASSPQTGHLYLLNEGPAEGGLTTYNLLFPTPSFNNGSPQLSADQRMQTGWYVFDEHQGTEKFWIVWAAQPVAELEAVKGVVNPQDKGEIGDQQQRDAIRDLLAKESLNNLWC
ncbi:MAG TPA: serine/threonine-protein kinase [Pyrinomonadaceae bacterium]